MPLKSHLRPTIWRMTPLEHTLWRGPICISMEATTISFTLPASVVATTHLAPLAEQNTRSRSADRPHLLADLYVTQCFPALTLTLTLFLSKVDAAGTACTNGGGTVVLESHGTVYGPGGQ